MIMKEIKNVAEFNQLLQEGKPVLLDFYAEWCGPCQVLLPTVEKLAQKHEGQFNIAKVNVDHNAELSQQFGIRSIPALFFIREGKVQERLVGLQTEATLEKKIEQYSVAV